MDTLLKEEFIRENKKRMYISVCIIGPFYLVLFPLLFVLNDWPFQDILIVISPLYPLALFLYFYRPISKTGRFFQRSIEFVSVKDDKIQLTSFKWCLYKSKVYLIEKNDWLQIHKSNEFNIIAYKIPLTTKKEIIILPDILENKKAVTEFFEI